MKFLFLETRAVLFDEKGASMVKYSKRFAVQVHKQDRG